MIRFRRDRCPLHAALGTGVRRGVGEFLMTLPEGRPRVSAALVIRQAVELIEQDVIDGRDPRERNQPASRC